MVYIALCALILGIIFGQFVLDSTWHDLFAVIFLI